MQTAMHPAFEQKLAVLAALLERSKSARIDAYMKAGQTTSRYQAFSIGRLWDVLEINTGTIHGFTFSYRAALQFVNALEAAATSNQRRLRRDGGSRTILDKPQHIHAYASE